MPNTSVSKSKNDDKDLGRDSYVLSSCTNFTKTYSQARKYVVDNSKPRTDLEYDPLSNFSADLRSYSSSGKEPKVKNGHSLKRARNPAPCGQEKHITSQSQLFRLPSPEQLDDSSEEGVLIIDIPPSPDKKRGRVQKPVDSVVHNSIKDKQLSSKEVKTAPVHSPPLRLAHAEVCRVTYPPPSTIEGNRSFSNCSDEYKQDLAKFYDSKECTDIPVNGSVANLNRCLEDLRKESSKIRLFQASDTVVESPSTTREQQPKGRNSLLVEKQENALLVELSQCKLPCSAAKMNPLQPFNFPSKNSLFYEAQADNSGSPYKKHTKQAQTPEPLAQNRVSDQSPSVKYVPSLLPRSQKTSGKIPGLAQSESAVNHVPSESHLEPAETVLGRSRGLTLHSSSASNLTSRAETTEQLFERADNEEVIIIDSSSDVEDQLSGSEIELSDSDPMEECYRIFMEANNGDQGDNEQTDVCVDVEQQELNIKPQVLPGKRRVAHESKHTEQPVAKSRPQPQVLVPLRGPPVSGLGSQTSVTSKIHQVQQRASMLTTSVNGGQALVSSTCQRRPETQSGLSSSALTPENLHSALVQNAYMNYIPLGSAVIEVGSNLHLILPQGAFPLPLTDNMSSATTVLTPISQVQTSAVAVKKTYHPPAVAPVQRYRTTAPVLIPAPTRKPPHATASAHLSPAASTVSQAAVKPTKRKMKQQSEADKDKVPHDVRQRYVNMFTEEFLKTTANVNDAFQKALAEERTVYNRSVNKLKYQSVAVNALKRLKNQSAVAAKDASDVSSQRIKGNIPLNQKKFKGNDDMTLYESLKEYILTEERLIESNYPVQHPEKPGCAVLFAENKKGCADSLKRICCRCGATYSVHQNGQHIRKEECNYHYGKGVKNKVPGGVETRYSCCEGVMGAPGCQVFQLHVHDSLSLDGFVSTVPRSVSDTSCPGVYSLDCEMCYTIHGLELSRVTLVNSSLQVVYDTFVRPDNEVIDYNTR